MEVTTPLAVFTVAGAATSKIRLPYASAEALLSTPLEEFGYGGAKDSDTTSLRLS